MTSGAKFQPSRIQPPAATPAPQEPTRQYVFKETPQPITRRGTGSTPAAIYHARHILPGEAIPRTWGAIRDRARDGIINAQRILADAPRTMLADIVVGRARNYAYLYGLNRRAQSIMEFIDLIEDPDIRDEAAKLAPESEVAGREEGNARRRVYGVSRHRYCVVRAAWAALRGNRKLWRSKGMSQHARKEFVFRKEDFLRLANSYAAEYRHDIDRQELLELPDNPFHKADGPFFPSIIASVAGKTLKAFMGATPVKSNGIVTGWRITAQAIERAMDLLQSDAVITPDKIESASGTKGMVPLWRRFAKWRGDWGERFAKHLERIAPVSGYASTAPP